MGFNVLTGFRILIGGLFVVSGFEKLIGPHQNFLYVVQSYQFLSSPLEDGIAYIVPWVEFILGIFLVLGLFLRRTLQATAGLMTGFICVVGQALFRRLPISECGCFGDLISFPPHIVLLFDSVLLLAALLLIKRETHAKVLSLDHYYERNQGKHAG